MEQQVNIITKNSRQYAALIHLGDLTQDNHPLEWYVVARSFQSFDNCHLPFTFSLGNHDIGSSPRKSADTRESTLANKYFSLEKMKQKTYWGGSQDEKIDNHYIFVSAGGIDWLIISLAFGPSDETLDWANTVVAQYPDRKVIVNTHAYMYSDDTRMGDGDKWLPQHYGIGKDTLTTVNDGEQIWIKFVSKHAHIIAVVSGHVLDSGVGTLVSAGINGNKVYQMLSNYQRGVGNSTMVTKGYYRILTFDKANRRIEVETVSAVTGEKHPSGKHNFIFENVDL
ncbi:MAG: phosphoesterase [Prevotellaceae bacterium]|nr:phosphoesterase [Prevotellaceae bacterium]